MNLSVDSAAPIALFAYKRPHHVAKTIEALQSCRGFDPGLVFVFCDGAKTAADESAVDSTRSLVRELLGPTAEYRFSDRNYGLANSIISGVTELCVRFGRVIVIEDDLIVAPGFLHFMNDALARYADCDEIMQISGYMFDVPELSNTSTAVLLPFTSSWGWATWARAWQAFDPDASGWELLRSDAGSRRRFNLNGVYDYYTMLCRQMAGELDSWAIRWYWSVFRLGRCVVFPPRSLVQNIGADGSGTHSGRWLRRYGNPVKPIAVPIQFPDGMSVDKGIYNSVTRAVYRQNGGFWGMLLSMLRRGNLWRKLL